MSPTDAIRKAEAEAMMIGYTSKFVGLPVLNSQQINELIAQSNEDILLVDVREVEEQQVSMLPTAISEADFLICKPQLSKSTRIVPYCTIGHRSGVYGMKLLEEGFDNVYNGEGIILWSHLENSKLVTGPNGSSTTNRVHTFGSQWDKVPGHIESVHFGTLSMLKAFCSYILGW
jgi:rhodanese-related sulfurtransferase